MGFADDYSSEMDGFEDLLSDEEAQEWARAFKESYIPSEHTTIVNPKKYKVAINAARAIKSIISSSIKEGFGDDVDAEYRLGWGYLMNVDLVFTVTLREYWIHFEPEDISRIAGLLSNLDYCVLVTPKNDGRTELVFEFRDVKTVIDRSPLPSDNDE